METSTSTTHHLIFISFQRVPLEFKFVEAFCPITPEELEDFGLRGPLPSSLKLEGGQNECVLIPFLPSKQKHLSNFLLLFLYASIPSCGCFSQHNLLPFPPYFHYVVIYILNTEIWSIIIINS